MTGKDKSISGCLQQGESSFQTTFCSRSSSYLLFISGIMIFFIIHRNYSYHRLEKLMKTVRESGVSRSDGGQIKDPPETPQSDRGL